MNEPLNSIIAIIGGLGIGSIITTYLQEKKQRSKFLYEQKLLTYTGYLESLSNVITKGSKENKQNVVYWTTRLKLVSNEKIISISMSFFNSNSSGEVFLKLRDEIIEEMAKDLRSTF